MPNALTQAANKTLRASESELKAEAKKREAQYAKQDAQLAELRMSSLGSSVPAVTTVVQTKEVKVAKVETGDTVGKEAAAAELEAQATKLQTAFDAKLESVRGKLQGQLDSTKAALEQVRSELTTTTKELKATTLELAELKEESAHALSALEVERGLRKDGQATENELARCLREIKEMREDGVGALRQARQYVIDGQEGSELEAFTLERVLAEFGLLHHWVAELQSALEAAGVVDDGAADLYEGFGIDAEEVRLDGHGDKVPADALSKLVGISVLEAMVARLPTKEQHLAALGLGMESSLHVAAIALDLENEEDARVNGPPK